MARNLVWKDLTSQQLESIRHPHPKKGLTGRDLLAKYTGLTDYQTNTKTAIHLDLYISTLQFGEEQKFSVDKLSGLFSIVKTVHHKSIDEALTMERSFLLFKELLLMHSVQRPPYSLGLFTYAEMRKILDWMLDSYYRHYKLYQYTYTSRITLSATYVNPFDIVELAPELPPLVKALTQEEHDAQLTAEQRRREQEEDAAAKAAAEAAEAERVARLREEYEAAIPDEVKDQVAAALDVELSRLKRIMEEQFAAQQAELLAKIAVLEAGGTPAVPGKVAPPVPSLGTLPRPSSGNSQAPAKSPLGANASATSVPSTTAPAPAPP